MSGLIRFHRFRGWGVQSGRGGASTLAFPVQIFLENSRWVMDQRFDDLQETIQKQDEHIHYLLDKI
jgi:hypothetical protein